MENTTLNLPKLEQITQVYKHRKNMQGGCRCGCLGTYWKKAASKREDRMIKKIYDLIVTNIGTAEVESTYIDVWIVDRFYTMCFEKVSQTAV